jgi:hypothetical protein
VVTLWQAGCQAPEVLHEGERLLRLLQTDVHQALAEAGGLLCYGLVEDDVCSPTRPIHRSSCIRISHEETGQVILGLAEVGCKKKAFSVERVANVTEEARPL